jgi:hypothetical protein
MLVTTPVIAFVRLFISFLIFVLKETDEILTAFLFKIIDDDNLFSANVARDVSMVNVFDTLSIFVCKLTPSCESCDEIDWIDADVFLDNVLVIAETSLILFDNLEFSYDSIELILVLKLTI